MKYWSLGVFLVLFGCSGSWPDGQQRGDGSVLHVDPAIGSLTGSEMASLRERGVGELFLTTLRQDENETFQKADGLESLQLPPGTAATLVVEGDPPEDPRELLRLISEARLEIESQSLLTRGVHLEAPLRLELEEAISRVKHLADEMPPEMPLSGVVPRSRLYDEGIEDWIHLFDFVVVRLYGRNQGEDDRVEDWSFEKLQKDTARMESIGHPWLLEIVTLGQALRLDARDAVVAETGQVSATELFCNRNLELRSGFSLEAANRHAYTLRVLEGTQVAGWDLRPGESVRVIRPATSDIESLIRLMAATPVEHLRGWAFHRLAEASEGLALSAENLSNALSDEPATPDLHAVAAVQRRVPGGWLFRFSLENRNEEITEFSLIDYNFVEIRLEEGEFGEVDAGDFYRYDLFEDRGGDLHRTFRNADVLRLQIALLAGEQSVHTGEVEIHSTESPRLSIAGSFLLPDGRVADVEPATWADGELIEPALVVASPAVSDDLEPAEDVESVEEAETPTDPAQDP